jgi:hypothetical protein
VNEEVDPSQGWDTERKIDPKDSNRMSENKTTGKATNILQLASPPMAAPMRIPLIKPSAEAKARIPIYFPRS